MEIEILRPLLRQPQIEDTLELVRKYLRQYNHQQNGDTLYSSDQYSFDLNNKPFLLHVNNNDFMSRYEYEITIDSFLNYFVNHFLPFSPSSTMLRNVSDGQKVCQKERGPYHDVKINLLDSNNKHDVILRFECTHRRLCDNSQRKFIEGYFIDLYINYKYIR